MTGLLHLRISAGYTGRPAVLDGLDLSMDPGEILALVGQSGSGKSSLALAVPKLLAYKGGWVRGEIWFEGVDLMQVSEKEMRNYRGRRIALVLQSPASSLNPWLKLGTQFREAWVAHRPEEASLWRRHAEEALEWVNLPADFLDRRPGQVSLGQAQRVLIAMAILHNPSLLIADEPTSALDSITQAGILQLFTRLNRELGTAILYISHDLLSVASLAHRVAILEQGRVVDSGGVDEIFLYPAHPLTRSLIAALPAISRTASLRGLMQGLRVADQGEQAGIDPATAVEQAVDLLENP